MILATLPYPEIDPVLIHIYGPVAIRWYALSYIAGLMFGWWAMARMTTERGLWRNPTFSNKAPITADQIGDLVVWATLGVILGGRIGWILFYGIALCGVSPGSAMCAGPLGGHPLPLDTDVPWAMVFCNKYIVAAHGGTCPAGSAPRHPSQLYEAALEGLVLFFILQFALRRMKLNERPGLLTGMFFLGYGVFRFLVEFFREPDGPFLGWFSMGMALSIPLWAAAGAFLWISLRPHVNGRA